MPTLAWRAAEPLLSASGMIIWLYAPVACLSSVQRWQDSETAHIGHDLRPKNPEKVGRGIQLG
jgi:hypothetical protein